MKKPETPRRARPSLFIADAPKWVRCYDDGGASGDRYTVVFTGNYTRKTARCHWYLGMSAQPYHPQGIGMHGESNGAIDRPRSSHLGKRITFTALPEDCQRLVLSTYCDLWDALRPLPDRLTTA